MKRDMDLFRKLVFAIEDCPSDHIPDNLEIDGYTTEQIRYHNYLLVDSGLAKGEDATTFDDALPQWLVLHLTSAGHDFADAARSDSIWNKGKSLVLEKAGAVSIDVMKEVLINVAKSALQL